LAGVVGWIIISRSLTDDERFVLRWLMTRGAWTGGTDAARAVAFLPRLDLIRVTGECPCGCPTIVPTVESSHLAVDDVSGTLVDVECRSLEGSEIGLILRAKGGFLSGLEAYARDGVVPFRLPTAAQLAVLE
jgi:hypothetical protein